MELLVIRKEFGDESTTGSLSVNGSPLCVTLEDLDRGLSSDMPLDEIKKVKVYSQTAIPTGRYKVGKIFWERFNQDYPHIIGVPGFDGVLIHGGVTDADTEGCILIGTILVNDDYMTGQPQAKAALFPLIFKALEANEDVWITIQKENQTA